MDRSQFLSLIHNYQHASNEDLNLLLELEKEFPYSQTIKSLVANAGIRTKTKSAKTYLGKAAIYASDRAVLKNLIDQKLDFRVSEKEATDGQKAKMEVLKDEPKVVEKKSKKVIEESKEDKQPALYREIPDNIRNLKPSEDREYIDNLRQEVLDNLNLLIDYKAQYKWLFEDDTKSKKSTTARKSTATKKTTPAKKSAVSNKTTTRKGTTKKSSSATKTSTTKKTTASKKRTVKKETSSTKSAAKTTSGKTKKTTKKSKAAAPAKKEDQNEIIDQFITSESEVLIKPKPENEPNDDLSRASTETNEDAVSENLAKILIEQGKNEKAIEIYKKLIWKFPQKKAYFASQIEILKGG